MSKKPLSADELLGLRDRLAREVEALNKAISTETAAKDLIEVIANTTDPLCDTAVNTWTTTKAEGGC